MRSGAVPLFISLANADQASVTHVDGDEQLFASFGRNGAFAKDHGVRINIIMDGGEFVRNRESHPGHDDVRHSFSVQNGEALGQLHVVDVVVAQLTLHINWAMVS